jgi:hypothetical protein
MGYYTKYTIKVTGAPDSFDIHDIREAISEITEYGFDVEEDLVQSDDAIKWYDHSSHMKTLAVKYPDLVFTLKGEGEEAGDIWRQFFKGDQLSEKQHAEFVFHEPPEWVGK